MGIKVFPISAATNTGLDELLAAVADILKNYPEDIVFEEDYDEYSEYENVGNEPFTISQPSQGYYVVEGVGVEKMIGYTNIDTEKALHSSRDTLEIRVLLMLLKKKVLTKAIQLEFTT